MTTTPSVRPDPVLPDFDGPCLVNLVPALVAQLQPSPGPAPAWLPAALAGARAVVLLLLDGLGAEQLAGRPHLAPTIAAASGPPLTSVAPSTTATALTSLSTGLPPAVHGVVGYRVAVDGQILNVLHWRLDGADARQRLRPATFQPYPAFPGAPVADGAGVPVVTRAEYATTGFTVAHLGGTVLRGWHTASGVALGVREALGSGARFVYAYYDGVDRVAHAKGLGEHYDAELRAVDRLVDDVLAVLPAGTALVVTADHGQVDVGPAVEVVPPEVMASVVLVSGEGRFRWLHARPGAADDVAAAAEAVFGHLAWVLTVEEMIDRGWLGGEPVPAVRDRLGDVALVPFEPTAFLDPADTGELRLVARHGSLTPAEMLVPLAAWAPAD
ncbi:MAG TPA: alkaline phosphatase family protein [Acidimicrobiales bacterium]|nr:alkaline phosphatase family protein [Acidimicrobiales bacterium]